MAYNFTKFNGKVKDNLTWLEKEFSQIRTGRASPAVLDSIKVESYGAFLSIQELANVLVEDARSIRIAPWDMSQAKAIEKAIMTSNAGLSVSIDDKGLRVIFPELTGERRLEIAKIVKAKLEDAKVTLRKYREEVMKELQALEKAGGIGKDDINRYQKDLQKLVDEGNKKLEESFAKKEKEILN